MSNLPFGFEKPEDSPGFLLWQTTMIWQRQIKKALEDYDISHPQFVILATLIWFKANHYDATQISIINWTKLDKMTVSKSLKKLVLMGCVERVEHDVDTRMKSVFLTRKGKNLIQKLIPLVEAVDDRFFGKTSAQERKSLINIFNKLTVENNDLSTKR
ncbi:MAG: MarR family winged helix-turn-helix transcriptional regulator [Gammaproteobacteria bacterium]